MSVWVGPEFAGDIIWIVSDGNLQCYLCVPIRMIPEIFLKENNVS